MKAVALLLALSASLVGASIVEKLTCQAGAISTASNNGSCGATDGFNTAGALITTALSVAANQFAVSGSIVSNTVGVTAIALSSGDLQINAALQLLGNGNGFMLIQATGGVSDSGGDGFGQVNFLIGTYGGSCGSGNSLLCANFSQPITVPIELGNTLDFSLHLAASSGSFVSSGGRGDAGFGATLSFFGSDGVTPIQIVDTPEPSTLAAMGVGLCLFAGLRRNLTDNR